MPFPLKYIKFADTAIELKSELSSIQILTPIPIAGFQVNSCQNAGLQLRLKDISDHTEKKGDSVSVVTTDIEGLKDLPVPPSYLWKVFRKGESYEIRSWSDSGEDYLPLVIHFDPLCREIILYATMKDNVLHALAYPAGSLLIYLYSHLYSSLLMHASLVEYKGTAYLFTGRSGKGKSTMAKIWEAEGATLIHDDRVVLKKTEKGWMGYSTPVKAGDKHLGFEIGAIFVIDHADKNWVDQLSGITAFTAIMEHCIQHQYDQVMINRLMDQLQILVKDLPVFNLGFMKSADIVRFITKLMNDER